MNQTEIKAALKRLDDAAATCERVSDRKAKDGEKITLDQRDGIYFQGKAQGFREAWKLLNTYLTSK